MKKRSLILPIILCIHYLPADSWGFDGNRQGFVLGGGLGAGIITYNTTTFAIFFNPSYTDESHTEFSFLTDLKIGYAYSEKNELFLSNKVTWFSLSKQASTTSFHLLTSAAVAHYYKPASPSPFVMGGAGVSVQNYPVGRDFRTAAGLGLFLGWGYEFARHYSAGLDLMISFLGVEGDIVSVFSARFVLGVTAY